MFRIVHALNNKLFSLLVQFLFPLQSFCHCISRFRFAKSLSPLVLYFGFCFGLHGKYLEDTFRSLLRFVRDRHYETRYINMIYQDQSHSAHICMKISQWINAVVCVYNYFQTTFRRVSVCEMFWFSAQTMRYTKAEESPIEKRQ